MADEFGSAFMQAGHRHSKLLLRARVVAGATSPPSPILGADAGTIDPVTQHEPANGRCSLCGRTSENVTTADLGNWIVRDGGVLICSECSSDSEKIAAGPETFGRRDRVENLQSSTAQPRH